MPDNRAPLPDFTRWPSFPFEGDLRVKKLNPPVAAEPPRNGEDAADCIACNTPDDAYVWVSERWRVRAMDRPTGLPMVLILECRSHLDLGDLPNLLAAELGVMTVRLERAIRSLDGVGRVHVNRWGDGSAHLHMWFLARPYGQLQLRGTFLSLWDDILPRIPEQQWRENLALVAAWLAEFGGRAIAEPPHIQWQAPATFAEPATATATPSADPVAETTARPSSDTADAEASETANTQASDTADAQAGGTAGADAAGARAGGTAGADAAGARAGGTARADAADTQAGDKTDPAGSPASGTSGTDPVRALAGDEAGTSPGEANAAPAVEATGRRPAGSDGTATAANHSGDETTNQAGPDAGSGDAHAGVVKGSSGPGINRDETAEGTGRSGPEPADDADVTEGGTEDVDGSGPLEPADGDGRPDLTTGDRAVRVPRQADASTVRSRVGDSGTAVVD